MNKNVSRTPSAVRGVAALLATIALVACGSGTRTRLRLVNASPDAKPLDVLVDAKTSATGVASGTASKYLSISAEAHTIQVKDPSSSSAPPSQNLNFTSGTDTTLLAASLYAGLNIVPLTDDNKAPASGDVKIRVVNTAQHLGAGVVDVYVVPPGTDLGTVSPTFPNVTFEGATAYHEVTAGSYEVYFTLPGQKVASIDSGPLDLKSGQIRTIVGLDDAGSGYKAAAIADVN